MELLFEQQKEQADLAFKRQAKIEAIRQAQALYPSSIGLGNGSNQSSKTPQTIIRDAEVIYDWLLKGLA